MIEDAGRVPVGARAWLGDGYSGASVAPDGTVDWFATDGLEAPADLYSLLDPAGGALRIGPAGLRRSRRPSRSPAGPDGGPASPAEAPGARYRPGTMVSDLDLRGPSGVIRITDLLPWPGPNARPAGRLVRVVTALSGPVEVEVEVRPGRHLAPAREVATFTDGLAWDGLALRTGFPLDTVSAARPAPGATTGADVPTWRGVRRLDAGQGFTVTLDRLNDEHHLPLSLDAALHLVETTVDAWRSWVFPLRLAGPFREAAERAALLLRALSGHGAPLAAGTTSLPRRAGSERTEDERLVRWRDAAGTAATLARVGLAEDAEAAEAWLRAAVTDGDLPWPAVSHADGSPVPWDGEELDLPGWRHSQPVRLGGGPEPLVDLDLYGDVVAAVSASTSGDAWAPDSDPWAAAPLPGPLTATRPQLAAAADWVADHWRERDRGVWALGGPPRLLTASRVQAWFALERSARLARAANPLDLDAAGWHQAAHDVQTWLETDALAADGGLGLAPGPHGYADAALLRVAWRSPWPTEHPIVTRTVDRILERLASGPLLLRHSPELDDGRAGPDHPDLLSSLWAVRALAALGRWEEAHERMEAVVELAGPSGILTAAADPLSGELYGNLPATGVGLAVLDAALALERGPR